jgi:hypothetical protein
VEGHDYRKEIHLVDERVVKSQITKESIIQTRERLQRRYVGGYNNAHAVIHDNCMKNPDLVEKPSPSKIRVTRKFPRSS